jgi:hypothetical protein
MHSASPKAKRVEFRRLTLITTHIDYKREKEVNAMRQRPHPYEFALHYDI